MRLSDKVIIITGSTTGIGRSIALRCAAEGARIVIHGLEAELGAQVLSEIGEDRAILHIGDLADQSCPERLVSLAIEHFGRLDAVVNNAALIATGNLHTTDSALFSQIIQINTIAPFLLIKAALPHLTARRGCILNIGSVNAWSGEPNLLPYAVSKGALMTMTRNLGDTLMRENGVRVNQINPGWVLTENEEQRKREHGLSSDWPSRLPKTYAPEGRLLKPEEIAAAAVYWLADESGPVSGQVVDIEQYPFLGRNPPKDESTIPTPSADDGPLENN